MKKIIILIIICVALTGCLEPQKISKSKIALDFEKHNFEAQLDKQKSNFWRDCIDEEYSVVKKDSINVIRASAAQELADKEAFMTKQEEKAVVRAIVFRAQGELWDKYKDEFTLDKRPEKVDFCVKTRASYVKAFGK